MEKNQKLKSLSCFKSFISYFILIVLAFLSPLQYYSQNKTQISKPRLQVFTPNTQSQNTQNRSPASKATDELNLTSIQKLNLTHTLFSLVVATYLKEGDAHYLEQKSVFQNFNQNRNKYLAEKNLILSFLGLWESLIADNFKSTLEIHQYIFTKYPFYQKYQHILKGLYQNPANPSLKLGAQRNLILNQIIFEGFTFPF